MGNPSENRYLSEHSQLLKHTSSRAKHTRVIFFYKQSMLLNIFVKNLTLTSQESLEVAPSTVQDLLRLCNPPCLPAVHKAEGLSPGPAIPSTRWGSCAHTQCCRCCHEPSSWGSWCDPNSITAGDLLLSRKYLLRAFKPSHVRGFVRCNLSANEATSWKVTLRKRQMGKVITPLWWASFELHCIFPPTRIAERAHVWPHTIHYEHTHTHRRCSTVKNGLNKSGWHLT